LGLFSFASKPNLRWAALPCGKQRLKKDVDMKSLIYLVIRLICLILATGCTSSDSESTNTPTASSTSNKSVERMLAEIDSFYGKGDPVMSDDDIRIKRIRYLINSISTKTGVTPYDVASWTAKYTQMIRDEYGKQINN
jgi:hypothetical protein